MSPVLLIPRPLHRAALRVVHAIRVRWWKLSHKLLTDCRIMAFGEDGRTLLFVRHSYGSDAWMLPGGALHRSEDVLAAAARELREETGCALVHARVVAIHDHSFHGSSAISHIVAGPSASVPRPDGREIIEAAFFPLDALPQPRAPGVRRHLDHWLSCCVDADRRAG